MIIDGTTIQASKAELRGFLAHASTDIARRHLTGLAVFPENGRLATTDGHRILTYRQGAAIPRPAPDKPFLIPRAAIEQAVKGVLKGGNITIELGPESAELRWDSDLGPRTGALTVAYMTEGGELLSAVPVEQVIPSYEHGAPHGCVALNGRYLVDVDLVAAAISPCTHAFAIQYGPTEHDPALIRFDGAPEWLVVIMGIRSSLAYSAPAPANKLGHLTERETEAARVAIGRVRAGGPAPVIALVKAPANETAEPATAPAPEQAPPPAEPQATPAPARQRRARKAQSAAAPERTPGPDHSWAIPPGWEPASNA